ncbi:peptidase inhibitor family I36 protein [Streptomyces flavotricini]|uniref:Peptidase inhibitor family I36 protein n=1 Tax=Streptomyces flavotricini TaxID=66888 RepID=A0ABS8DZ92_9ACTN|nr:peptidase inhibitor family I36 protein [Streptomyces flavotricini]MCC0094171.1 peptidase inhibitor family I36 protein [Streptomyces flavotricini]
MRKFRTLLLAGALAVPLLAVPATVTAAGAATAGTSTAADASTGADASGAAADGNYWVWEDTSRGGHSCGWSGNDSDWRTCGAGGNFNMNDRASSWWNNGYAGSFGDVRVYENINYGGASTCAPNGGAGNVPWEWNDRISSHKWVNNCGF